MLWALANTIWHSVIRFKWQRTRTMILRWAIVHKVLISVHPSVGGDSFGYVARIEYWVWPHLSPPLLGIVNCFFHIYHQQLCFHRDDPYHTSGTIDSFGIGILYWTIIGIFQSLPSTIVHFDSVVYRSFVDLMPVCLHQMWCSAGSSRIPFRYQLRWESNGVFCLLAERHVECRCQPKKLFEKNAVK